MKPILALACGALLTSLAGCGSPAAERSSNEMMGVHNLWANRAFREMAVEAAVVRERTLYPHHFVDGRAQLNQLGMRDLGFLAGLFREEPGSLNVRRGSADDVLYQARLDTVRGELEVAGIDASMVDLGSGTPGGDGTSSARAIEILSEDVTLGATTSDGAADASAGGGVGLGGTR